MSGSDPEETMPFTHRAYGSHEPVDPATAPEGWASQPSGAGYVAPELAAPVPYGTPVNQFAPAVGATQVGPHEHRGASTARTLGIVSLLCGFAALFVCITLPGVFCAPFAWVIGARARKEIDANPGVYSNRGQAQAGIVMGIIGTIVGVIVLALTILVAVMLASMDWTLV